MSSCGKNVYSLMFLKNKCTEAADFLVSKLSDGHYYGRSFYGETYTALAMSIINYEQYQSVIQNILDFYYHRPKDESNFHWEFNNYALLMLGKKQPDIFKTLDSPLPYRGIKCTNWTLLRCVDKLMEGISIDEEKPKEVISSFQMKNGLILDEDHVSSFQYHCFSLSLIYELYSLTSDVFYKDSFMKGVEFIKNFTLRDGDTLLIGRGQEQIFGYGTLIFVYWEAYDLTGNKKYLSNLLRVLSYVFKFWNETNILPLVLNEFEKDSEKTLDVKDSRHLGWYSYNNYFDYLPFFVYYLAKTVWLIAGSSKEIYNIERDNPDYYYCDGEFLRYSNECWDIVMGCKRYASANALTFPYITYQGNPITTVCGGEDFFDVGYYQPESIQLPYGRYANKLVHVLDSRKYFKKYLRSLKEHNVNISDVYLWILGDIKIVGNKKEAKFSLVGKCEDYEYSRDVIINNNKLLFTDTIKFKRDVSYKFFVALNLVFKDIEAVSNNTFRIPGGKLSFINRGNNAIIEKKKYRTAKSEVDRLVIVFNNFKSSVQEAIKFQYSITCE